MQATSQQGKAYTRLGVNASKNTCRSVKMRQVACLQLLASVTMLQIVEEEEKSTVILPPKLARIWAAMSNLYGTKKKVVGAAVLMFSQATSSQQLAAIRAAWPEDDGDAERFLNDLRSEIQGAEQSQPQLASHPKRAAEKR